MRGRDRSRRRRRPGGKPSWWIPAWGGIGLGALGLVTLMVTGREERLGPDLCPGSGPTREVVLLVDPSSPLSGKHRAALKRLVSRMDERKSPLHLAAGERLSVYHLGEEEEIESGEELDARLEVCHPGGRPEDRTWVDDLTEGQLVALRRWRGFEARLDEILPEGVEEDHTSSPILETIGLLAERHHPHEGRRTTLVLWSDLVENSRWMTQYKKGYPTSREFLESGEWSHLRTDLSGIDVAIYRLERPDGGRIQDERHYRWWREVLAGMGAAVRWARPV